MLIPILIIILLLAVAFIFSASEMSFYALNKSRLKKSAESGDKKAKTAYELSNNFTSAISAILIGNNIANIGASAAATLIFVRMFELTKLPDWLASVLTTVIMTVVVLTFAEIIPKTIGKRYADKIVLWIALPIRILTYIFLPVILIINGVVFVFRKIWRYKPEDGEPSVTEEELSTIIEAVEEEGVIDEDKSELLQSSIDFSDTTVEEIMIPRIDMEYIYIDDDPAEIKKTIESSTYSRIPVCEDNIDDIIGILSLNHYYKALIDSDTVNIRSMLIEPCFVYKTMKLPAALKLLREKKTHLAIVIDEFGGTMGLFTMEDILEELVGDIWDESDEIENEIVQTGDNSYEVSGDMNIDDFFDQIDFEARDFECEYSTVGGFAIEQLNADPHVGDSFNYENLYIVVTEMDDMRVTKLSVMVQPKREDDDYLEDE